MIPSYQQAFEARNDLKKYGKNALALFALQLRFQFEDIDTVATSALTEATKGDDKKCDLIHVDKDTGYIIVIQAYMADNPQNKQAASSNKASDLNTAAAWLLNSSLEDLPQGLQSAAKEVRSALENNIVNSVQFWYVHNCPESKNVKNELAMVEQTVNNALKTQFPKAEVENVIALEVGQEILDEWYKALKAPILVTNTFCIPISGGYTISDSDWSAFVTAIPIPWLHEIFKEHSDKLFSANVRSYLGSRKSTSNINHGIKETATNDPNHFWAFNNGITVLVNDFEELDETDTSTTSTETKSQKLKITGMSIVNGAQTTGAIGSLKVAPCTQGKVQARFVKCSNFETIRKIIEYNNRQNEVEASDFRSNDPIQSRLREEFKSIPDTEYYGGRRGGYEDVIRRPSNLLPSDTVAQSLVAFHQDPVTAYNNKSDIWKIDTIYSKYFNEQTTAEHIIFAYSLLRAIEEKKRYILNKQKTEELSESERQQLDFFNNRGSHFLLTAGIAKCIEIFLGKSIPNSFKVSFGKILPSEAEKIWISIVDITIPFSKHLMPALNKGLNRNDEANKAISNFKDFVESTKDYHTSRFESLATKVHIRS